MDWTLFAYIYLFLGTRRYLYELMQVQFPISSPLRGTGQSQTFRETTTRLHTYTDDLPLRAR